MLSALIASAFVIGLGGCSSWVGIPPEALPRLAAARNGDLVVRTKDGAEFVDPKFREVEVEPPARSVFMSRPGAPWLAQPVLESATPEAQKAGWTWSLQRFDAPIAAETRGPWLLIAGRDAHAVAFPRAQLIITVPVSVQGDQHITPGGFTMTASE